MSLATRQSQTLLACIGGCLLEINRRQLFPDEPMKTHCVMTYQKVLDALKKWPESGDTGKNVRWCMEKVELWQQGLPHTDEHVLQILAAIMEQCLADVRTVTKNDFKTGLLNKLVDPVAVIYEITGLPDNIHVCEEADRMMKVLYELIEWKW